MPEEFTLTGWLKLGGLVRDTRLSQGLSQAALATQAMSLVPGWPASRPATAAPNWSPCSGCWPPWISP